MGKGANSDLRTPIFDLRSPLLPCSSAPVPSPLPCCEVLDFAQAHLVCKLAEPRLFAFKADRPVPVPVRVQPRHQSIRARHVPDVIGDMQRLVWKSAG